jgi:hypothetical protein
MGGRRRTGFRSLIPVRLATNFGTTGKHRSSSSPTSPTPPPLQPPSINQPLPLPPMRSRVVRAEAPALIIPPSSLMTLWTSNLQPTAHLIRKFISHPAQPPTTITITINSYSIISLGVGFMSLDKSSGSPPSPASHIKRTIIELEIMSQQQRPQPLSLRNPPHQPGT